MKAVGVRDLKNRLSEYLRFVRLGQGVLVTDRGVVVAELLPPGQARGDPSAPVGLQSLVKRGLMTLGAPTESDLYPVLPRAHGERQLSASHLLNEERVAR